MGLNFLFVNFGEWNQTCGAEVNRVVPTQFDIPDAMLDEVNLASSEMSGFHLTKLLALFVTSGGEGTPVWLELGNSDDFGVSK